MACIRYLRLRVFRMLTLVWMPQKSLVEST